MKIIIVAMTLAGLFGFSISIYFFTYRTNLAEIWRVFGASIGGLVLGSFFAIFTFLILFPPMELWFTIGGLGLIFIIAAILLLGGRSRTD